MSRPKKKRKTIRLNLDVSQETRDRLDRLQEKMNANSMTEVIARALVLCETLCNSDDVVVNGKQALLIF